MQIRLNFSDDMSKEKEILMLDKLCKTCQTFPNNYLPTLFTSDFVAWATQRIKDDFPLDVMEYIKHDSESEKELLELTISDKDKDIQRLFDDGQEKQEELKRLTNGILELQAKLAGFRTTLDVKNKEVERLLGQVTERDKILAKKDEKLRNLSRKYGDVSRDADSGMADLREENIHLKARLFDLTQKQELEEE